MFQLPTREEFKTDEEYIKALSILAIDNIEAWVQLLYEHRKRKNSFIRRQEQFD